MSDKPSTPVEDPKDTEETLEHSANQATNDQEAKDPKPPKEKKKKPKKETPLEIKEKEIVKLNAEVTALKDQLLREQAELVNFKRRITDEKIKDRKFANASLLKSLLPVIDHLEAALKVEGAKEDFKPFLPNFQKLHENFLTALKESGLEPIEALDKPFDPTLHEAVMQESKEGVDPGMVTEEFQKGYRYHERILRPAMVKVSE